MTTHGLTLGALSLSGADALPDATHGFWFRVVADGMTFGSPASVEEVVLSLISDGDLARITRYGNREVAFGVEINGPSLAALAEGEAALRRQVGIANLLTWQPPDLLAPPSVFEVITSGMAAAFDDLSELRDKRTFRLTLTCSPFARSVNKTEIPALAPPASTNVTSIDTCDSVTGWTSTRDGAPIPGQPNQFFGTDTVSTGGPAGGDYPAQIIWTMTRTGLSQSFATQKYLVVEARTDEDEGYNLHVIANGGGPTISPLSALRVTDGTPYVRFVFDMTPVMADSVSSLRFVHVSPAGVYWPFIIIRDISKTADTPGITSRQQSRVIDVGGTERTPGSIQVSAQDGTTPTGLTIVATSPDSGQAYAPSLRRWRVSGNPVTSAPSSFSGGTESIKTTAFVAKVPTSTLPEGGYELVGYMKSDTTEAVRVYWTAYTRFPAPYDTAGQGADENYSIVHFTAGVWRTVRLGIVTLPTVRTNVGMVQIDIQSASSATSIVTMDEAWLFRVDDDCAWSAVVNQTPNLWLDSASTTNPQPQVWVGDAWEKRFNPASGTIARGVHVLSPEGTAIFTATSGVQYPAASASFYMRWHSNAAE